MKLRDLYKLPVMANKIRWKGTSFMSYRSDAENQIWYEDNYGEIHHPQDNCYFIEPQKCDPDEFKKDEAMLNSDVPNGYWILTHTFYDCMVFFHYKTPSDAIRNYRKTKINSICHPNSSTLDKFLFFCTEETITMKKHKIEGKISKFLLPKYYKYIRDPILSPLDSWWNLRKIKKEMQNDNP